MSETWNASIEEQEDDDDESGPKCSEDYAHATINRQVWDDDVIDLSEIDLENEESWLFKPNSRPSPLDLQAWLRRDLEKSCPYPTTATDIPNISKSTIPSPDTADLSYPIDTRTFTRSKKKLPKLNMDSIRERALPIPSESSPPSPWTKMKINWKEEEGRQEDSIPAMLRQSLSGLPSETAQESLEAFLNMSQSKGIDSFINLAEPEFNESLMNISRPSFLHTTISNQTISNQSLGTNISMADSQILTESMMQTSIFNDDDDTVKDNTNFASNLDTTATISNSFLSSQNGDGTFTQYQGSTIPSISRVSNILSMETTCNQRKSFILNETCNLHESFIVNKTFDRVSDSGNLSETITLVDDESKCMKRVEVNNSNETFVSNGSFLDKIPVNSTFSHDIEECDDGKNDVIKVNESFNSTYVTNLANEKVRTSLSINAEEKLINDEEPSKSLDMTYSKRDFLLLDRSKNDDNYQVQNEELITEKLSKDLPENRYQTYRKTTIPKNDKLARPLLKKIYQGKSMESLHKVSSIGTLDSRDIYGPKSLSRLPQTLQKSNPNLGSSHSNLGSVGPVKKRMIQTKFGFQYGKVGVKNGANRLNNLNKQGSDKVETRNSSESIESTLSTYSGPDFDDGLSTCSDGSRHSEKAQKISKIQEEKLNHESTPKTDRKILENTWITGDLPSPILKNNQVSGRQPPLSMNSDAEMKTSSPILSPAESLQSLPTSNSEVLVSDEGKMREKKECLPVNRITSVFKTQHNLENKTEGVRLPASRSSNLPSGIPRPASRIPAPRFSRATAQVKTQTNHKKSLF